MTEHKNIREILGGLIGASVCDVTQHDEDEFLETGEHYVALHFSNGATLTVPITDRGFDYEDGDDNPTAG